MNASPVHHNHHGGWRSQADGIELKSDSSEQILPTDHHDRCLPPIQTIFGLESLHHKPSCDELVFQTSSRTPGIQYIHPTQTIHPNPRPWPAPLLDHQSERPKVDCQLIEPRICLTTLGTDLNAGRFPRSPGTSCFLGDGHRGIPSSDQSEALSQAQVWNQPGVYAGHSLGLPPSPYTSFNEGSTPSIERPYFLPTPIRTRNAGSPPPSPSSILDCDEDEYEACIQNHFGGCSVSELEDIGRQIDKQRPPYGKRGEHQRYRFNDTSLREMSGHKAHDETKRRRRHQAHLVAFDRRCPDAIMELAGMDLRSGKRPSREILYLAMPLILEFHKLLFHKRREQSQRR